MELRLPRKGMAAILSVMVVGSVMSSSIVNTVDTEAIEDIQQQIPAALPTESVILPTEDPTEAVEEDVVNLWKADLSEYGEALSLVSYESVELAEEETTEAEEGSEESVEVAYTDGSTTLPVPDRQESDPVSIASGSFGFTTYGYGHGVGLSQNGANYYASYGGWNYQQILSHYYPGTSIGNTGTAQSETITAGGVSGSVSDIVSGVVYREIGESMNVEAIRAQAVAVYTYIKYKGGNAGDLYTKSNPPQKVVDAVNSVLGQAVYYNGGYAMTMFYASSGGSTASCRDIFYEDIPYLRSVSSEYDSQCDPNYGTVTELSASKVKSSLESCLGISLSDNPENWISVIEGDGGYAASVVIDGQVTIKGSALRSYLGLKSANFTCTYY